MIPKNPYNAVADVTRRSYERTAASTRLTALEAIQSARIARDNMAMRAIMRLASTTREGIQQAQPIYKQARERGIYQTVGDGAYGKITDYGQTDDPDWDSLTAAGKSAIGDIIPGKSMALSRDMEALAAQNGVKIGDDVEVELSDGTVLQRKFDDRTAAVYKGVPLTGRVDLHTPQGQSPYRDARVVAIRPLSP
jgi:hypothetical protein